MSFKILSEEEWLKRNKYKKFKLFLTQFGFKFPDFNVIDINSYTKEELIENSKELYENRDPDKKYI